MATIRHYRVSYNCKVNGKDKTIILSANTKNKYDAVLKTAEVLHQPKTKLMRVLDIYIETFEVLSVQKITYLGKL